jgi:hypothetical protein
MPAVVVTREALSPGTPVVIDGLAPDSSYAVVFEDDGDTGYFYGLDRSRGGNQIVDTLHIYNVASVSDKDKPSEVEIAWSSDSKKAFLFINRYPHGAFDFAAKRGYCRSGFPPPDRGWTEHSHEWSDDVLELLK